MNDWDRLPGEPARWYARFDDFRLLGPGRSLHGAFRQAQDREGFKGKTPGHWWVEMSRRWRWQKRAEAWDSSERDRFLAKEEERRRAARERRLHLLGEAREQAWKAILAANLSELDEGEARQMLGALRMLLFEAVKGERLEMGEPTEIVEGQEVVFRADDLAVAQEKLEEWRKNRQ